VLAVEVAKAPPMPAPCVVWGSPAPNRCRHPCACQQRADRGEIGCQSAAGERRQIAARRARVRSPAGPKPDFGPLPRNFADPLVGHRLSWWNDRTEVVMVAPIVALSLLPRRYFPCSWSGCRPPVLPLGPVDPSHRAVRWLLCRPCGRLDPCHRGGRSDLWRQRGRTRITTGAVAPVGPWLRLPLHLWGQLRLVRPWLPSGPWLRIPCTCGASYACAPVAPVAPVAPAPVAPVSPVHSRGAGIAGEPDRLSHPWRRCRLWHQDRLWRL